VISIRVPTTKADRCKRLAEGLDSLKATYFMTPANLHIDSLDVSGQDDDGSPLLQEAQFRTTLNQSGGYLFFSPNLFLGLDHDPFMATLRQTDISFGYLQNFQIGGTVQIPDGYQVDSLPGNLVLMMPDTSIVLQRVIQLDDGKISLRIKVVFKKGTYPANDYDHFRDYYKRLIDALNEPVVMRKKSS
jgi:hypothetical protein